MQHGDAVQGEVAQQGHNERKRYVDRQKEGEYVRREDIEDAQAPKQEEEQVLRVLRDDVSRVSRGT